MNQMPPSISMRVSHKPSVKRGWTYTTSVQITMGEDQHADGHSVFPSEAFGPLMARWVEKADIIGRTEAERRNQRDGWVKKEDA